MYFRRTNFHCRPIELIAGVLLLTVSSIFSVRTIQHRSYERILKALLSTQRKFDYHKNGHGA